MMLKKRVVALVAGIALMAAVVGASAGVAHQLVNVDAGQAIACVHGGSSGGGC